MIFVYPRLLEAKSTNHVHCVLNCDIVGASTTLLTMSGETTV
jgi:hypothetical protein